MRRLRRVTSDDEAFLLELYVSSREEEVAAWGWSPEETQAFLRMQFDARSRGYREAYPGAEDQVILLGDEPVGRITVQRSQDHVRLVDLAVLPRHRSSGIGSALIRELIEECRSSDRPLRLQVARDNRAVALYERLGFTVVSEDGVYREMAWGRAATSRAATLVSLDDLTAPLFAAQVGTAFQVVLDGVPALALELADVTVAHDTPAIEQFSLVFRGPLDRVLSQGLCRMEHASLGQFTLFIVPIEPDRDGARYEAVFNRLRAAAATP